MSLNTPNKHLSYFKVENFKRFKSLELKDIGQFNIIVGDNNTGKTSLLEALLINSRVAIPATQSMMFQFLAERLRQRKSITDKRAINIKDVFNYFFNNSFNSSLDEDKDLPSINFSFKLGVSKSIEDPSYSFLHFNNYESCLSVDSIPFVGFGNFYDSTFEKKYAKHIQTSVSQKNKFTQRLKAFINDISYLDMSLDENRDMKLLIAESHKDATTEIGKFGEGSLKLARILVDTMVYTDDRLMIDEVEAGVHWSRFQVFWKTILLSAIENNTQLFMTTHDAECLQYLINAVDETPELASVKDKFRLIELRERTTDNDIAPIVHNYEALHYFLENGREVRGGHIVK